MKTIKNPITGRKIAVGGPTFNKLKENPKYRAQILKLASVAKLRKSKVVFPKRKLSKSRLSQLRKLPGSGSLGRYTKKDGPFCGPEGGAAPFTFPVGTKKRAINAISRSVNAPNPSGIRRCATRYAVKKGWMTKEHAEELMKKYK